MKNVINATGKKICKGLLAILPATLLLSSCTLSEPDSLKDPGEGNIYLTSISSMTLDLYKLGYDSQKRVVEVQDRMNGVRLFVNYGQNEIIVEAAGSIWDNFTDEDNYFVESRTVMSNLKFNSMGYITSLTSHEYEYNAPDDLKYEDVTEFELEYDSDGHLTVYRNVTDNEVTLFNWNSDGNMTSYSFDGREYTLEYSRLANKFFQWMPFWDEMGVYRMTNLFGKGPANLVSKVTEVDNTGSDYYYGYDIDFAYKLTNSGLISSARFSEYGDIITMVCHYGGASL